MGDANPIRTLGNYSSPSYEGYRNTIELPEGNNVVPLRSDIIQIHLDMGGSYYSFFAQLFPSGRTAKLRNDILMFQQQQGESLSESWTRFKDLLKKGPHHGIDL
nr:zinc finger, CCHC-type [Tanacetum cinerariifolium]